MPAMFPETIAHPWSFASVVKQELSPPGSYADQGLLFVCPAGRYGATHGLSSPRCSGVCTPGFYCPAGSISPRQRACGGASVVCPAGSGWPIAVDDG